MNKKETLVRDIIGRLSNFADPERKVSREKSHPTSMQVLGVKVPDVRAVLKAMYSQLELLEPREKIALAVSLIDCRIIECQCIAYLMIDSDKGALKALEASDLKYLGRYLDNWVSVDTYSIYILGYLWRTGRLKDGEIFLLLDSQDVWQRRCAVVATVALNLKARGAKGDVSRTLDVCTRVLEDRDDMIVKALSWALRELAKREADVVRAFIDEYEGSLSKRVLREVRRKLDTGTKN